MSRYEYSSTTGRYEQVDPPEPSRTGRLDFHRVHLDRQGYTRHGRYFGTGAPLYEWYDNIKGRTEYVRANSRAEARRKFQDMRSSRNPLSSLSTGTKVAIGLGLVAVVGGIGYYLYQQNQPSTAGGGSGGLGGSSGAGNVGGGSISGDASGSFSGTSGGDGGALGPAAGTSGTAGGLDSSEAGAVSVLTGGLAQQASPGDQGTNYLDPDTYA
jgi:hypothetical protein